MSIIDGAARDLPETCREPAMAGIQQRKQIRCISSPKYVIKRQYFSAENTTDSVSLMETRHRLSPAGFPWDSGCSIFD